MIYICFGIIAGLSARAAGAYHWYTTQTSVSDPTLTPEKNLENETSAVAVSDRAETDPDVITCLPGHNIEPVTANLMADVITLGSEKAGIVSEREALFHQLRKETFLRESLKIKTAQLRMGLGRMGLDQNQSDIEKSLKDEQEKYFSQENSVISGLQLDRMNLKSRMDLDETALDKITTERDQLAAKIKSQEGQIRKLQSDLKNALAKHMEVEKPAISRKAELCQFSTIGTIQYWFQHWQTLFKHDSFEYLIDEMETLRNENSYLHSQIESSKIDLAKVITERDELNERNCDQETRIRRLLSDLQCAQADTLKIRPKFISYQRDLLKAQCEIERYKTKIGQLAVLKDELRKRIAELEIEKNHHRCGPTANTLRPIRILNNAGAEPLGVDELDKVTRKIKAVERQKSWLWQAKCTEQHE